jgi:hypothetical protein
VLVKRSTKRWFEHHEAILAMLRRHCEDMELHLVVFDDQPLPSLPVTMDTFHRAVVVIAPHGAGLTNMLFSQPGTLIIEAVCQDNDKKFNLCYQRMASVLGMRYYALAVDDTCMVVTAADVEKPFVEYMRLLGYLK